MAKDFSRRERMVREKCRLVLGDLTRWSIGFVFCPEDDGKLWKVQEVTWLVLVSIDRIECKMERIQGRNQMFIVTG